MKITDEAVNAALNAWVSGYTPNSDMVEDTRAALTAALPHLPAGYAVKQLEWVDVSGVSEATEFDRLMRYFAVHVHNGKGDYSWALEFNGEFFRQSKTLDEAKALAQADFERRIGECIDGGVDVAEVRRQALEDLIYASIAALNAIQHYADVNETSFIATRLNAAIDRALSAAATEGKQWSSDMDLAPSDTVILMAWFNSLQGGWEYEAGVYHSTRVAWWHGSATHWMTLPDTPTMEEEK